MRSLRSCQEAHRCRRTAARFVSLRRVLRGGLMLAMSIAVASCAMIETMSIRDAAGLSCQSAAGAYFLPKRHINVQIEHVTDAADPKRNFYALKLVESDLVADRNHIYCLDYLGSPTAEDKIKVDRSAKGLLQEIAASAEDKSKDIALAVLDIGLITATGNPDITTRAGFRDSQGKALLAEFDFDPFDSLRLAEVNLALTGYGYCIVIDRRMKADEYCRSPYQFARRHAQYHKAEPPATAMPEGLPRGIFYRPETTHFVGVMRRRDPGSRSAWEIHQTKPIQAPNTSPIFSIPVERSFFVDRKSTLTFNDGVLADVTIEKPSELLAVAELPLIAVAAIAKIPAEIVKVRLSDTNNRQRIIDAQTKMLQTIATYNQSVKDLEEIKQKFPGNRSLAMSRDGSFVQQNRSAPGLSFDGVAEGLCAKRCTNKSPSCRENCKQHVEACSPADSPVACVGRFNP